MGGSRRSSRDYGQLIITSGSNALAGRHSACGPTAMTGRMRFATVCVPCLHHDRRWLSPPSAFPPYGKPVGQVEPCSQWHFTSVTARCHRRCHVVARAGCERPAPIRVPGTSQPST